MINISSFGAIIVPGIVMIGYIRHCGTRAHGIMLRLHLRVTYWWLDSVRFNGVHHNIKRSELANMGWAYLKMESEVIMKWV
jgi:hypothetical protein